MPVSAFPGLTDSALALFAHDGFVVVRGLFSTSEVEQARRYVEEVASPSNVTSGDEPRRYSDDSARDRGRSLLSRVEYFRNTHRGLGEMTRDPKLLGIVSLLLGEPAVLFKDKINYKRPGSSGFEPHQDAQAGWETYAASFVTALVSVDSTTIKNGCLEIAAKRHRDGLLGPLFAPIMGPPLESLTFQPVTTDAGDVVFFGARTPHQSAPNCSGESRRVLYLTYNGLSAGDQYERYFAEKLQSYPPDDRRAPGALHRYRV